MAETDNTMNWGAPVVENKNDGIATMTQGNPDLLPEEVNWDFVDFLSSQEFVPEPVPSPLSPSLPHVENFKQKEELEMFLQQQKEAERAFLLQQEEEVRRKQEEEAAVANKQGCENESVTVHLDILAELRSLKHIYQTSLLPPKRKRPSRAKQSTPSVTTSTVPPLVISTQSLTRANPEVGLGRGKSIRQLKQIMSRSCFFEKDPNIQWPISGPPTSLEKRYYVNCQFQ
jgi:hypothetical protein